MEQKILQKLEEWEKGQEGLAGFSAFYQKLHTIQAEARTSLGTPRLSVIEATARDKLSRGVPLLDYGDLPLDWRLLGSLFHKVADAFLEYGGVDPEEAKALRDIGSDLASLREIVEAWYQGREAPPSIERRAVDAEFLDAIIQVCLKPFLVAASEAVRSSVDQERWRRRYCPVCGGRPDFAFLDQERGARWLLCSRCDAQWLFKRLECPYCGNQEQDSLSYFTCDDNLYRLYVCEKCRTYLKAVDLREAKEEVFLPLERLLTGDLDRQAQEKGYHSGAESKAEERSSEKK